MPDMLNDLDSPGLSGHPTLARMDSLLQEWSAVADRRRVFLNCYMLMTRNMILAIDAGEFADAVWVEALLRRFADYYFDALDVYDGERTAAPPVWQAAHDATCETGTFALQNLLLGINAHINYDLALTLVDMLQEEWAQLHAAARGQRYADHCHVNRVISRTIDIVQDEVIERLEPRLDVMDRLMGRGDEWLAAYLISRWRDQVWRHAVAMLDAPDADSREERRRSIEALTLTRARIILGGAPATALHKLL